MSHMVEVGRTTATMNAAVEKMSDEAGSGILYMRFSQLKPDNSKTWRIETPTPEKNTVPTQVAKK